MSEQYPNFRRLIKGLEVQPAVEELAAARGDLWKDLDVRQKYEGSAHVDTESIVLRGPTTLEGVFDNLDCVDFATADELPATSALVRYMIEFLKAREIGRIMIVRLNECGWIRPHVDKGAYARYFARVHLVFASTVECMFRCGEEVVHMGPGEVWWFNHQLMHSVVNSGPPRIHLIMDFTAPGFTGALANIRVPD